MVEERSVEPTSERELTLTRVFAVPARILFLAWSRPEHLMKWFGPGPYPLTFCEMDFRVGGKYRFAMTGPDGRQGPFFGGEYLVIDQDRTISYTNAFEQAGTETMIVTVRFTETAGKTTLVHHTLFASAAMKRAIMKLGYEGGVGMGLDQLVPVVLEMV